MVDEMHMDNTPWLIAAGIVKLQSELYIFVGPLEPHVLYPLRYIYLLKGLNDAAPATTLLHHTRRRNNVFLVWRLAQRSNIELEGFWVVLSDSGSRLDAVM